MNDRDNYLLERFLSGELTEGEKNELNERLGADDFAGEYALTRAVREAIRQEGRDELKAQFREWDRQNKINKRRQLYTYIGAAASVLLLVLFYVMVSKPPAPELLVEQYLEPYPNIVAPLQKSGGDTASSYEEAFRFYELGYYGKAEREFLGQDQSDEAVQFYRGVTALLDDRTDDARALLQIVADNDSHRFNVPGMWYYGMALVESGDSRRARKYFAKVAESDHPLASDARKVLDAMNG